MTIREVTHEDRHARLSQRSGRRSMLRLERRRARVSRRVQRGQTLIIFALSFTVLLSLAGLAIDVARAYDLYAKMQRAAEAGALAGVLYLPNYYSAARTPGDGLSAVSRATSEVVMDGFGTARAVGTTDCPTPVSSVEVAVCQVSSAPDDLEVFITEHLNLVLLSGLGMQPITLQAKSQASYTPPVQVASRANFFGDEVECSPGGGSTNTNSSACAPSDTTQNHLQYFMATMNGPADLKESGDPYVYCAEGNADPGSLTPNSLPTGPDPGATASTPDSLYTYNGYLTNHPQWPGVSTGTTALSGISTHCGRPVPGGNPGNPDYQPDGYCGPITCSSTQHAGGYNYYIGINSGVGPSTLWIYNPFYVPQDANLSPVPLDHFTDNTPGGAWSSNFYQGPTGEGIGNRFDGVHHDAPLFYYSVTYSLYTVKSLYDRSSDPLVATETFNPFDATSADLSYHGCISGQVYNPFWNGPDTPNFYHKANQVVAGQGCVTSSALSTTCTAAQQWCELQQNCQLGSNSLLNNPELTCLNNPAVMNPNSSGAVYRLVVETQGLSAAASNANGGYDYVSGANDGWGQHAYAIKACASTTITSPINCSNGNNSNGAGGFNNPQMEIFGWNNSDIKVQEPLTTTSPNPNYPQTDCVTSNTTPYACVDLGCIPTAYAGRTLTLGLFDPGDGTGDLYAGVAPPPNSSSTVRIGYPSYASTSSIDGVTVVQTRFNTNGYRAWNGVWLNITIQLAPNYTGSCFTTGNSGGNSGWFQLVYASANGQPTDTLAVQFNLVGSPVHLVIPA